MVRYLLDTNIVIAHFAQEPAVDARLVPEAEIFIPSIVLGELYYGAEKSGLGRANRNRIEKFAANNTVIACDAETARRYAIVRNRLRLKGRPIPENDMWIAAAALQYNMVLVTRDAHFRDVEYLKLERW
ncbi:MAG: type II toxin-antitoxin system VapC family toxin [Chloroflexota bacterium]|nr:type II toxin-antitoxin system VapC family toxin [Chloroflexota bacterium]MDQ5864248.1 type II toxin-antitoxin system VapC family toxin [Chloroflexota bacterium]